MVNVFINLSLILKNILWRCNWEALISNHLVESSKICEDYGYDEINLNVGCPSDRVQKGRFGACLMLEPNHVAECLGAMKDNVSIPVSIKCRLGSDDHEDYEFLYNFIEI